MISELVAADPADHGEEPLTTEQFEQMDWTVLKRMAANSECDEIDYMSTRLEVKAYYGRQRTLGDYDK
jgi:hypothetical protein